MRYSIGLRMVQFPNFRDVSRLPHPIPLPVYNILSPTSDYVLDRPLFSQKFYFQADYPSIHMLYSRAPLGSADLVLLYQ